MELFDIQEEYIQSFDAFLTEELSEQEKRAFEQRLERDADFRISFENYKKLWSGMRSYFNIKHQKEALRFRYARYAYKEKIIYPRMHLARLVMKRVAGNQAQATPSPLSLSAILSEMGPEGFRKLLQPFQANWKQLSQELFAQLNQSIDSVLLDKTTAAALEQMTTHYTTNLQSVLDFAKDHSEVLQNYHPVGLIIAAHTYQFGEFIFDCLSKAEGDIKQAEDIIISKHLFQLSSDLLDRLWEKGF